MKTKKQVIDKINFLKKEIKKQRILERRTREFNDSISESEDFLDMNLYKNISMYEEEISRLNTAISILEWIIDEK